MKGDFTGFKIDGIHSSDLGIVRVSDGDRYKEEILPEFDDGTVDIPGGDGTYYFGSYYKSKKFNINIAFDSLTELQYRNLSRVFGVRKPRELIFDERPYKKYYVKVESSPNIDAICFDEGDYIWDSEHHTDYIPGSIDHKTGETENIRRVYKGEGEINFIAYDPFGYIVNKDLDSYRNLIYSIYNVKEEDNPAELGLYELQDDEYILTEDIEPNEEKTYYKQTDTTNTDEWAATAKLKTALELLDYDIVQTVGDNKVIKVYNPGDMPAPFQIYIPFSNNSIPAFEIILEEKTGNTYTPIEGAALKINAMTKLTEDATGKAIAADDRDDGVLINTKNHLIEGVKRIEEETEEEEIVVSYNTTGTLYNDCVESGIFFEINTGTLTDGFDGRIRFSVAPTGTPEIIYDYIYF